MSLDLRKLEKQRELASGIVQARCPACAEGGHDQAGEHLRVYPDGRFGCAVYPKDRDHRKRIFALAGDRTPRQFTVKVADSTPMVQVAQSVAASLAAFRTLGTPVSKSESHPIGPEEEVGTLRTPLLKSSAHAGGQDDSKEATLHRCKDNEMGVLSVLSPPIGRMPHFTPNGAVVIPFDCPERFHWWKLGGQSITTTIEEIRSGRTSDGADHRGAN